MMIPSTRNLALAVIASLASAGAFAGGYAPLGNIGGGSSNMTSANRRPAGAHKAAHRAALKTRRVKQHRMRMKNA